MRIAGTQSIVKVNVKMAISTCTGRKKTYFFDNIYVVIDILEGKGGCVIRASKKQNPSDGISKSELAPLNKLFISRRLRNYAREYFCCFL